MTVIYKVCGAQEWADANATGVYPGSLDDKREGFIHFSTAAQLPETLARHFTGRSDLLLLAVDANALGDALKWELARGGALFPHLYGPLPLAAVLSVSPVPLGDDGRHLLPGVLP